MIETAARIGLQVFLGSAVFVGCWLVLVMFLAMLAGILGGRPDDEDEEVDE